MFDRKNLEGKERKWKEIYYFPMFGSLKKIKWKEMGGMRRKDFLIKFHFPFLSKVGEFGRKEKINTKHGKLSFFFFLSLQFYYVLFPSFLFSSFPLLKMNQTHCNRILNSSCNNNDMTLTLYYVRQHMGRHQKK